MGIMDALVSLEATAESQGWDSPSLLFEVSGGELLLRAVGGHPIDEIERLREEGWHPRALVMICEGWATMTREEAERQPEWADVPQEIRDGWEIVQRVARPSEMQPFCVDIRTVLYADAMGEQHLLTRRRGEEPYWVDDIGGEVMSAALAAVTPTV